jgi:hypothetical protein
MGYIAFLIALCAVTSALVVPDVAQHPGAVMSERGPLGAGNAKVPKDRHWATLPGGRR